MGEIGKMLSKLRSDLKICVLIPCFRRPEYTAKCIKALEEAQEYPNTVFFLVDDGSEDGTEDILRHANLNREVIIHYGNMGLRNILIDFIEWARLKDFDFMGVVGNDCLMPKNWLNDLLSIFEKSDVQVLSPNVFPSNAAYRYGQKVEGLPYMPSQIVGGLWFMYVDLVKGLEFVRHGVKGIKGAFNILKQILIEREPKVGWASEIMVQDLGHWSGMHPEYIKSEEHLQYYQEIGRNTDMKKLFWYPLF
jgi:glycosyltransferase involved in cell wall biosynthesis